MKQILKAKQTADGAEAREDAAAAELGKFKDVRSLLEAYQALEAEFTRRSQRLKELEANKEGTLPEKSASGEAPSEVSDKEAAQQRAEVKPESQPVGADKTETAATVPLTEEMKNAVIEEYLNSVCNKRGVPFVTGGGAVAAQRRTPKTLKEAGALAGKLFNKKEEN